MALSKTSVAPRSIGHVVDGGRGNFEMHRPVALGIIGHMRLQTARATVPFSPFVQAAKRDRWRVDQPQHLLALARQRASARSRLIPRTALRLLGYDGSIRVADRSNRSKSRRVPPGDFRVDRSTRVSSSKAVEDGIEQAMDPSAQSCYCRDNDDRYQPSDAGIFHCGHARFVTRHHPMCCHC